MIGLFLNTVQNISDFRLTCLSDPALFAVGLGLDSLYSGYEILLQQAADKNLWSLGG